MGGQESARSRALRGDHDGFVLMNCQGIYRYHWFISSSFLLCVCVWRRLGFSLSLLFWGRARRQRLAPLPPLRVETRQVASDNRGFSVSLQSVSDVQSIELRSELGSNVEAPGRSAGH